MKIVGLTAHDIRFPTSRTARRLGRDAPQPRLLGRVRRPRTPTTPSSPGTGSTFTNGRGNEVCVAAIHALEPLVVGRTLEGITGRLRRLLAEPRLGGPAPLARAREGRHAPRRPPRSSTRSGISGRRRGGVPLWRLLADLSPEEIVAAVDFRYITDALAPDEAVDLLRAAAPGRERARARAAHARLPGVHDVGRLARLRRREGRAARARSRCADGLPAREDEGRRRPRVRRQRAPALIRDALGDDGTLMMDANQVWGVDEAIAAMRELAAFDPWWIEEPTSPDDVLGHARIRAGRSRRSRSRRASTCRTGSSSSSCCRPTRSTSCRSTRAASRASTR